MPSADVKVQQKMWEKARREFPIKCPTKQQREI